MEFSFFLPFIHMEFSNNNLFQTLMRILSCPSKYQLKTSSYTTRIVFWVISVLACLFEFVISDMKRDRQCTDSAIYHRSRKTSHNSTGNQYSPNFGCPIALRITVFGPKSLPKGYKVTRRHFGSLRPCIVSAKAQVFFMYRVKQSFVPLRHWKRSGGQ